MANYDNPTRRYAGTVAGTAAGIDQGLRTYMLRVYNYMVLGLALTGLLAVGTFMITTTSTPTAWPIGQDLYLTSLGYNFYGNQLLQWVLILAPLGLVLFLGFRIAKMSVAAAQTTFLVYAGLLGISLSSIFIIYDLGSIAQVFFITAATFGTMSLWGYTTKRDLTGMGSFLFMGLIGIIIAMVVNWFLASPALSYAISVIGVLVFTGLTAYDTQRIKNTYDYVSSDGTMMGRAAIIGALQLYLNFINLFLMLLRLFGSQRS